MGQSIQKQKLPELQEALRLGDQALPDVTALLDSGMSVDTMIEQKSALYYAIEKSNTLTAELLLERKAKVELGYHLDTPLHIAASKGSVRIAMQLLDRGAKVNAKNSDQCTPLWLAVSHGRYA
ncbi:hypothetical protein ACOMHN_032417 [Nucella lapillus]